MNKFFLPLSISLALLSCNKENKVTDIESTENKTVETVQSEASDMKISMTEYTPSQVSDLLTSKDNDTLYVTNFFATWCGPCMKEIPHFKEKMKELKGQPVKFTFISLDDKSDWETEVKKFGEENNLTDHIILLDGQQLSPDFFSRNFKTWDGGAIPFTHMQKGNKTDEFMGMMTKKILNEKINALL